MDLLEPLVMNPGVLTFERLHFYACCKTLSNPVKFMFNPLAAAGSYGMATLQKCNAQRSEAVQSADDQEWSRQALRLWTGQICLSIRGGLHSWGCYSLVQVER